MLENPFVIIILGCGFAYFLVWLGSKDAVRFYLTSKREGGQTVVEHSGVFSMIAALILFFVLFDNAIEVVLKDSAWQRYALSILLFVGIFAMCETILRSLARRKVPDLKFNIGIRKLRRE